MKLLARQCAQIKSKLLTPQRSSSNRVGAAFPPSPDPAPDLATTDTDQGHPQNREKSRHRPRWWPNPVFLRYRLMLSDMSKNVLSDKFLSFTETLQLSTVSKTGLIRSGYTLKKFSHGTRTHTSIPKDYPSEVLQWARQGLPSWSKVGVWRLTRMDSEFVSKAVVVSNAEGGEGCGKVDAEQGRGGRGETQSC